MSFKGLVNVLLMVVLVAFNAAAQPANDACNNAETLCPGVTLSGSNFDATSTVCPDCEDDFTFCFSGDLLRVAQTQKNDASLKQLNKHHKYSSQLVKDTEVLCKDGKKPFNNVQSVSTTTTCSALDI